MAAKAARPGRTLTGFFVGLAIAYGLVALTGTWKPELGLDLQGGTSIRLIAEGSPTADSLEEARKIIDQRVNGSGVAEAEVTVQGNRFIVVEIPGSSRADLEETVKRQAQLRFRLVACIDDGTTCGTGGIPNIDLGTDPGTGVVVPSDGAEEPSDVSSGGANRAPVAFEDESPSADPSQAPADTASDTASEAPTDDASDQPTDAGTGLPVAEEPTAPPEGGPGVDDPLTWIDNPNPEAVEAYNNFSCAPDGSPANVVDDPTKPLVTCGTGRFTGVKYLLSASMIEGTELSSAEAAIPQGQVNYVVALDFDGSGTKTFAEISRSLVGTEKQFAIVLDGQVLSAPTMEGLITDGNAQISGDFTQASAESLATSLKFGALPIAFDDKGTTVETIGPSLAGNQLSAGLLAGGVGLGLVMIYCLLYYRGLGTVIIASLFVAGASTYAMVLLLSETANFTLTLPGIAGLIVAVGITADSFIVYFERIRDEMRDGKSMRVAVEAGWVRARATCVAADSVSLLAAVVLYIFAAGVVKGFAFALGLSTIIDLVVFFWFTKPMVSYLARFKFFNSGHKLSGLDAEVLGIDKIVKDAGSDRVAVGGRA
ncbi:protein translocase subunit SecD [Nocardioides sp.]|uniref:protein translocase subunit SecD n=1 Tax=Nocardioides sp. TaxID=35761 RepID=UPI003564D784